VWKVLSFFFNTSFPFLSLAHSPTRTLSPSHTSLPCLIQGTSIFLSRFLRSSHILFRSPMTFYQSNMFLRFIETHFLSLLSLSFLHLAFSFAPLAFSFAPLRFFCFSHFLTFSSDILSAPRQRISNMFLSFIVFDVQIFKIWAKIGLKVKTWVSKTILKHQFSFTPLAFSFTPLAFSFTPLRSSRPFFPHTFYQRYGRG
jgi:hypothetical protein